MKNATRYLTAVLLIGLLLSQYAPAVRAAAPKLPSGIGVDELGGKIEEYVAEHGSTTAGMSVSVFQGDDTIYTGCFGYADKEAKLAVDQDTVMEWGSITKLLVWVSVMQLWEQGKLDLDTDIRQYLPDGFLTNLRYDTPVTMTHLMNHTAGFQERYTDLYVREPDALPTLEEALKAHEPEQIYAPGAMTAYSNWGAALAGFIVERISGEDFTAYVHQHIFEPLGMEHSALAADLSDNPWVQEKRKELQCYTADGALKPDCLYYLALYPAGTCTSTMADLATFGKALLDETSPLFRSSETWKTLFTPTAYLGDSGLPANYHGFWVFGYGTESIGHTGNTLGCSSALMLDLRSKTGVAVMTNQRAETIYNLEMPKLIFGAYSAYPDGGSEPAKAGGIYCNARAVQKGPFRLIWILPFDNFIFPSYEMPDYVLWARGTSGGVEKICASGGDLFRVPVWHFVWEAGLIFLWGAALLVSLVSLLVKLLRKLVHAFRKTPVSMPLGRWSAAAESLPITAAGLYLILYLLVEGVYTSRTYTWIPAALGLIAVIAIGLTLYGIAVIRKTGSTKKQKFYHWAVIFALTVTAVNILYWELFMWWKI